MIQHQILAKLAYIYGGNKNLIRTVQLEPEVLQSSPELTQTIRLRLIHLHDVQSGREYVGHIGRHYDAFNVTRLLKFVQLYVELGEIFERKTVNRRFIQPEYNVAFVSFVLNEEQLFGSDISCIIDIITLIKKICAREKSETSVIRL